MRIPKRDPRTSSAMPAVTSHWMAFPHSSRNRIVYRLQNHIQPCSTGHRQHFEEAIGPGLPRNMWPSGQGGRQKVGSVFVAALRVNRRQPWSGLPSPTRSRLRLGGLGGSHAAVNWQPNLGNIRACLSVPSRQTALPLHSSSCEVADNLKPALNKAKRSNC